MERKVHYLHSSELAVDCVDHIELGVLRPSTATECQLRSPLGFWWDGYVGWHRMKRSYFGVFVRASTFCT